MSSPPRPGPWPATEQLRARGEIGARAKRLVALLTASGLKDTAATAAVQGELPPVPNRPGGEALCDGSKR